MARLWLRLPVPPGWRRRGLERLFAATARAFGTLPPPAGRPGRPGARQRARLEQYARFTRERAAAVLAANEADEGLRRALYGRARTLGRACRRRLGLRTTAEGLAAARVIYRCLGIDFRYGAGGRIVIPRCAFSAYYTPEICELVSCLDAGLLSGLCGGGELRFRERITCGAPACAATLEGAPA